jgi:predicted GNAT family N-acyltransferase
MHTVEQINTAHPLYEAERELRNKVLNRPFGLPDFAWEKFDNEAIHFILKEDNQIHACLLLVPKKEEKNSSIKKAQFIQMAVTPDQQGKGFGQKLIKEAIEYCKVNGIDLLYCHARANAVSFYEKLDFETYDEPFEEVGIWHRYMRLKTN